MPSYSAAAEESSDAKTASAMVSKRKSTKLVSAAVMGLPPQIESPAAFRAVANCCAKSEAITVPEMSSFERTVNCTMTPGPPRYGVQVPHDAGQ